MITRKRVEKILSGFSEKTILVFGDIILDRYIFGAVERISPEAPVPVIKVKNEEFRLGGAGNVALNIDSLGGKSLLLGVAGDDIYGREVFNLKSQGNKTLYSDINKTIVKTRVICQRQQIVRIDREQQVMLTADLEENLIMVIRDSDVDGIIISDYGKGSLSQNIMDALAAKSQKAEIPLIVDPKPPNFHLYRNITGITPNQKEAEKMTNQEITDEFNASAAAKMIRRRYKSQFSLITRGSQGMTASQQGKKTFHLPAYSHEVFDVTGAGDTVVSVLTMALISGADMAEAVNLANAAASIVIEKIGATQVTAAEIYSRTRYLAKRK